MAYFVCHCEKLKGNLGGFQSHFFRQHNSKTNPDIKKNLTEMNLDLIQDKEHNLEKNFARVLNLNGIKKCRINGVKCLGFIISASHDEIKNWDKNKQIDYFRKAQKHLEKKLGKENLLYSIVHFDEHTPHLHIGFVPIKDNKLCAKKLADKLFFKNLQTDFYNEVGRDFGLAQGESKQKHLSEIDFKIQKRQEELSKFDEKHKLVSELGTASTDIREFMKSHNTGMSGVFGTGDKHRFEFGPGELTELNNRIKRIEVLAVDKIDEKDELNKAVEVLKKENTVLKSKVKTLEGTINYYKKFEADSKSAQVFLTAPESLKNEFKTKVAEHDRQQAQQKPAPVMNRQKKRLFGGRGG